jgi:hypothetical protein
LLIGTTSVQEKVVVGPVVNTIQKTGTTRRHQIGLERAIKSKRNTKMTTKLAEVKGDELLKMARAMGGCPLWSAASP